MAHQPSSTVNGGDSMKQDTLSIVGYADQFSVRPGEEINFMISTTSPSYSASVVRLTGGITEAGTSNLPSEPVPAECAGVYPGRHQIAKAGSYAELPLPSNWLNAGEFTVQLWMWPTTPASDRIQTIWSALSDDHASGAELALDHDGQLVFSLTDGSGQSASVRTSKPLSANAWYFVAVQYSAHKSTLTIQSNRYDGWTSTADSQICGTTARLDFANVIVPHVLLAAQVRPDAPDRTHQHLNGKLEDPRFFRTALEQTQLQALMTGMDASSLTGVELVADYDFSAGISSTALVDRSTGSYHGILYQAPTRAVTSHNWTGEQLDFRTAPEHYAAVHFHEDDIEDAGWEADITWRLPEDLAGGTYALKLDVEGETDYIPFFVRPASNAELAPVLFLAPTNTYLAYANERLFEKELDAFMAHEMKLAVQDRYLAEHPELGKSIYDSHSDGSGIHYSSRRRPIMNIRPHYRNWLNGALRHLAADLYITGWLEKREQRYDIATDEDLDREGIDLLMSYRVLITGSHPEYWTRPMMNALKQYLANGGRLMYLGANGFYWVTSLDRDRPHMIEVRRGNAGTRSWDSPPGELFHSTTGEPGGLWRHYGFVPQQLVGIGFTAQGWGPGSGYRRLPDSMDPRAQFIFEGIGENETIGDFGLVMGGAAGDEVDRLDYGLGTPAHALWLATSIGLDNRYQLVHEDQLFSAPGQGGEENPLVRADMTYFDIVGGGGVFSVGSINWGGSMAWNDYDNNVARITDNVLKRFLE